MSISFPFTARTQENFLDVWNDRRNFLIGPELVSFTNTLPSAEEVIDILRKDPDSRVQFMKTADGDEKNALIEKFKTAPLEQVGNPDNFGSIFRNAAAFGVDCVLLNPTCCDPLYRKAIRTSLGATLRIPYGEISDWPDGLIRLGELGFSSVALTPEADATSLATFAAAPPPRLAILLGAEGVGLSDEATAQVDHRVRIPIARGVDSLNVATTAGIALYTLAPPL